MVENNESAVLPADEAPTAPPPAVEVSAAPVATAAVVAPVEATDVRRHRRQMIGKVVSTASEKTAIITVTRTFLHPKVRKYVRRSKKYMAHDAGNICSVGDEVLIEECRPLSKNKRWRLREIVRKQV